MLEIQKERVYEPGLGSPLRVRSNVFFVWSATDQQAQSVDVNEESF